MSCTTRFRAAETKKILKRLKGLFAVYKDTNRTNDEVFKYVTLQLEDDLGFPLHFAKESLKIRRGKALDDLACGIQLFAIGNLPMALNEVGDAGMWYNANICLGKSTSTLYSDGIPTEEMPYDHITLNHLKEVSQQFIGLIKQQPWGLPYVKKPVRDDGLEPSYIGDCRGIEFTDFHLPYVSLKILGGRNFHVSCLLRDLAKAAGTCAYVTKMERFQYGPFTLQDALPSYQWGLKYIIQACEASREKYIKLKTKMKPSIQDSAVN